MKVSSSTVSWIFTSWINLLYLIFRSINFWLPKHTIQETMPDSLRLFSLTRVILDAAEFKIQTPSSLLYSAVGSIFSRLRESGFQILLPTTAGSLVRGTCP